jgi:PAS domain S-box-containing protein
MQRFMENKKIKILAIDDNRDNLITLKAVISEVLPESVVYVELSGQGGIESARKNDPDVILLDIVMPGLDGYEVCKILKADEQLSETPIIFLTALKGDKQSRILALEAGGEAFLAKPVDSTELKAQIQAMLKIKEAATYKKDKRQQLEELVQKRTEELKSANIAALNLLEDLNSEIEIRKQSELELKKSEEKFRNIFQKNVVVKLIIDPENGNIIDANQAASAFYGWPMETLQKMNISQINTLSPEDLKKELEKARTMEKKYFEFGHRKADGSLVDVEVFSSCIKIGNKEFLYSIIHDITYKKKAEEKLKLLNRAVEASSVSVVITDAEGQINYINPYFTKLTGYSFEEARGKNPRVLKSGNQPKTFYEELWNSILSGNEWSGEFNNKKKNGELFWEKAIISPILNSEGKVINFVAIKEDITERKKMLEELVAAKEHAEESDRLKSAFLANMSHEIRTPMNGILGFSELLKEPGLTGEQQQHYIRIIEKSGVRMLNIINQIIDISKIEAGLMKLEMQESNINEQIEYIHTFFKPEAETKGINLSFRNTLPQNEAIITTDREKLYAILTNLVKNAIKYTKEGSIEFGYKMVETQCIASPQNIASLQFYVKDTGIGIPKNRQEAIFERFIQADITDKMAYQGAGLGLTISKAYVEMLGGKIWVESEEGIGSTFYFTLPFNAEQVKETSDRQPEPSEKNETVRELKILIAEDDEVSEMLIDNYIKIFGKEILKARTGIEAVEICRANQDIDLILMDIRMPDMGGYEATRQIRLFNQEVVIIAQTAYGLTGDREKSMEAGCNDYISKPINKDKLLSLIQKYLKK